jgi:hypothetical protein
MQSFAKLFVAFTLAIALLTFANIGVLVLLTDRQACVYTGQMTGWKVEWTVRGGCYMTTDTGGVYLKRGWEK